MVMLPNESVNACICRYVCMCVCCAVLRDSILEDQHKIVGLL